MMPQDPGGRVGPASERVRFPLWLKLGSVFGLLTATTLLVAGVLDYRSELRRSDADRHRRLLGLAQSAVELVAGDRVTTFRRSEDMQRQDYRQLAGVLRRFRDANNVQWTGLYGQEDGRFHYLVSSTGASGIPLMHPYFDPTPGLRQAFAGEAAFEPEHEDEFGLWDSAYAPVRDRSGEIVAVLAVETRADWRTVLRREELRRVLLRAIAVAGLVLLVSVLFARYLASGIRHLADVALAVGAGSLECRPRVDSHDEVGLLARTLDSMITGLQERDRI